MLNIKKVCITIAVIFFSNNVVALDTIEVQLRWHHQFQFAGYYAALEQGYYKEAGLDVILTEGRPDKKPVIQVLNGQAHYGVGNSEVLLQRLQGAPLVALAAVLQHSPSVLIAKKDSNISTPHDLIGKTVMMMSNQIDADFVAMFHNENIDVSKINIIPSSYDIKDLANGQVDAFNAYLSNEPFYLKQLGIEYTIIKPLNYSVDFYSDILFTTEDELHNNPKRVQAFQQASLRGWQYALAHREEIIDLLLNKYHVDKTKEHLNFEADAIQKLVLPTVVELGHMNPWRWQHMAKTFVDAKMVTDDHLLAKFDYQQITKNQQIKWGQVGKFTSLISIVAIIILVILTVAYRKTRHEIRLRLTAEKALKELAYTDSLTGVCNRHQFFILAEQSLKNAIRAKSSVALLFIDLDRFKQFNDDYGHHIGDFVLKTVADTIKNTTRQSDIISRVGGDEFVIILENITSKDEAGQILSNIKHHIEQPIKYEDITLNITLSIGLSLFPDDASSLDDLMRLSDSKMYQQKNGHGHNI